MGLDPVVGSHAATEDPSCKFQWFRFRVLSGGKVGKDESPWRVVPARGYNPWSRWTNGLLLKFMFYENEHADSYPMLVWFKVWPLITLGYSSRHRSFGSPHSLLIPIETSLESRLSSDLGHASFKECPSEVIKLTPAVNSHQCGTHPGSRAKAIDSFGDVVSQKEPPLFSFSIKALGKPRTGVCGLLSL